jgi:hypothetical protein
VLSDGQTLMGSHAVMGRGCPTELFPVQAQPLSTHLNSG